MTFLNPEAVSIRALMRGALRRGEESP